MIDEFIFNNEEEAEMGQVQGIFNNMNAIAAHRAMMDSRGASFLNCIECGEEIPQARRIAVKGCERCISCQTIRDRLYR